MNIKQEKINPFDVTQTGCNYMLNLFNTSLARLSASCEMMVMYLNKCHILFISKQSLQIFFGLCKSYQKIILNFSFRLILNI